MAAAAPAVSFRLNSGASIPAIGLGTGLDFGSTANDDHIAETILTAIEVRSQELIICVRLYTMRKCVDEQECCLETD